MTLATGESQLIETLIAGRQAGLGWHIELYIPQTSCQASCLPPRPVAIKVKSTTEPGHSAFRLTFRTRVFPNLEIPQKHHSRKLESVVTRGNNYSADHLLLFQGKRSRNFSCNQRPVHAGYYRFHSTITAGLQVSCCETDKR